MDGNQLVGSIYPSDQVPRVVVQIEISGQRDRAVFQIDRVIQIRDFRAAETQLPDRRIDLKVAGVIRYTEGEGSLKQAEQARIHTPVRIESVQHHAGIGE